MPPIVDFSVSALKASSLCSGDRCAHVSVSTAPVETTLTRSGFKSKAKALPSPSTAERASAITLQVGIGFSHDSCSKRD